MPLQAGVVDISISPPNQVPSPTMGPLGRLQHLVDGQVRRYEPQYGGQTGITPAKIEVGQRDAFVSLPSASKAVTSGASSFPAWTPPELLGSLGTQFVSIADAQPRVFDGASWRTYPNNQVLTNILSQATLHTSQKTIQAPDSAWLAGVTCYVWTESVTVSTGVLTCSYVSFRADDGTWLLQPTVLFQAASSAVVTMAKVVTDGTTFFVFFNNATNVLVNAYNGVGLYLGQSGIALPSGSTTPGAWDIIAAPSTGGYTVLYAQGAYSGASGGITTMAVKWNGSAIQTNISTDVTMVYGWLRLSFLTNDTGNGLAYLATVSGGGTGAIQVYEITNQVQTHYFNPGVTTGDGSNPDTVIGWVTNAVPGGYIVNVAYTYLPGGVVYTSGPLYDPAYRYIKTFQTGRTNSTTVLRTTQSLCAVSRAFAIDGQYCCYGYYQSGSGIGIVPQTQNVAITNGDYMIGALVQSITVAAGDETTGSPLTTTQNPTNAQGVFVTAAKTSTSILAGDTAVIVPSSGNSSVGIPDGTPLLRWSFANLSGPYFYQGSRFTVAGANGLNSTFDILVYNNNVSNYAYTPVQDIYGNSHVGNTFTLAGNFTIASMVTYGLNDLSSIITAPGIAAFYLNGGTITVSGAGGSGNNGTFAIKRISTSAGAAPNYPGMNPSYYGGATYTQVWVQWVAQTFVSTDTFAAVVTPNSPNTWYFSSGLFDSSFVGTDIVVTTDPAVPGNVGTYVVTAASGISLTTAGATSILPQIFSLPLPTVQVQLTSQPPNTFYLQSLFPLNWSYQNAFLSVQGADPTNNGVYQITQLNASGTINTIPTNGLANQVNQAFNAGGPVTITLFIANNINPEFQPTWFLVPLSGTQPTVGCFERGLAYSDWRIESDATHGPSLYPGDVASVPLTTAGLQVVLPYRAQNVTAATLETTPAGQVNIVEESYVSTVGLKAFTLGTKHGRPFSSNGELSIPGPMATVYTPGGFLEDGQNLAPETPFIVAQSVAAAGTLALTLGGVYFVVAVLEYTDENGRRTYSAPSPALQVNMSGTNNVATYGGRLPYPLGSTGLGVANTYGPTTRLSGISLYRTAFINGQPTAQHFKITNDLNINGLAPISVTNASGFSFPDTFTWHYIDTNTDSGLNASEILYTDKSLLPRYPAPPFRSGFRSWMNREWVIGYDNAVWMSGENQEGDATWYNPAFRFPFAAEDPPMACAGMDEYLVVLCANSIWYIPAAQFPDATGGNGSLPTPVRMPFPNGSANGFAEAIREGVVYDSTAGGVWLISRQLENKWLSKDMLDTLSGTVSGMCVDKTQRLFVMQAGSQVLCVYDGVPQCWYEWNMPTAGVLLASLNGAAAYQDANVVALVTPGTSADTVNAVTTGIAGPDVTIADMALGNIRGLKKVWEFQANGTYKGPHNANVVLTYPEDGWPTCNFGPLAAVSPYVLPFNPNPEDASVYNVRIYPDFAGIISPGATFALETISAQVGLEPVGLNKLPQSVTMKQR